MLIKLIKERIGQPFGKSETIPVDRHTIAHKCDYTTALVGSAVREENRLVHGEE